MDINNSGGIFKSYNTIALNREIAQNKKKYPNAQVIVEKPDEFKLKFSDYLNRIDPNEAGAITDDFVRASEAMEKKMLNKEETTNFAKWLEELSEVIKAPSILVQNKIEIMKEIAKQSGKNENSKILFGDNYRFLEQFIKFKDKNGDRASESIKASFSKLYEEMSTKELSQPEIKNILGDIEALSKKIRLG